MLSYVLRRLVLMFPTLIGVTMVVFFVMALSPGGFGAAMLNEMGAQMQGEDARRIRQEFMRRYGLDQPAWVQYGRWVNQISPIGFHMSADMTLSDEERERVQEILTSGDITWRESSLKNAINIVQSIVFYAGKDPENIAGRLRQALDDPLSGLELFALVDAKVDEDLRQRLEGIQSKSLRSARDFFVERFSYEAMGRNRVLFSKPAIKWPDLGKSLNGRPVGEMIRETLPITLLLNLITIPLSYSIAILTGIYSARHRGKLQDIATGTVLLGLWSIPVMWAGVMFIGFFANVEYFYWFPTGGLNSLEAGRMTFLPTLTDSGWESGWLIDRLWHLVLPVICLTYGQFAVLSKLMRSAVLDNLSQDYVRTARAKGVADRDVLWRHVFRNSLLPLITVVASILPAMLVGAVVVEKIFSIQGMGWLGVEAAFQKDREVVMATTLFASILSLGSQILRDVCYAIADPRVSYE